MILSQRVHHSLPSRNHVSCDTANSELAPSSRISSRPLNPTISTSEPRSHYKHAANAMAWLNRNSSSNSRRSIPHAAPKPIRISEPKLGSSLEQFNSQRCGPLGCGATIVRTPQEALSHPHHTASASMTEEEGVKGDVVFEAHAEKTELELPSQPPPSNSPLPPLPNIPDGEEDGLSDTFKLACIQLSDNHQQHLLHSLGSASSAAHAPSSKPTLVSQSRAHSRSVTVPVALIDTDTGTTPPQPPFDAILLSPIPDGTFNPSKLIVTLETCTVTYRACVSSLVSRPSHLSQYITTLLSPVSETASVYSNASDASLVPQSSGFSSTFRDHLASSGCLPRSLTGIHIFLDRPSAPYTHVLAYLRSLPSTPEQPEALPRAMQLQPGNTCPSRLESLLELRDEASYLGLTELERLCRDEIYRFRRSAVPVAVSAPRAGSGVTLGSGPGSGKAVSIRSFRTLVEERGPCKEPEARPASERQISKDDGAARIAESVARKSSSSLASDTKDAAFRERGRERRGIKYEVGSPPPGWI